MSDRRAEQKLLVFEVSGSFCGLPVELVREIAHIPAVMRVPGQPSILEGFLNLRGQLVALVSLARLLRLPSHEPGLYASVIFVRGTANDLGVLVDSVDGVMAVAAGDLQPLPANYSLNDCLVAHFTSDNRLVTLLAVDRILLDEERQRIADLAEQARRRLEDLSPGGSFQQ